MKPVVLVVTLIIGGYLNAKLKEFLKRLKGRSKRCKGCSTCFSLNPEVKHNK
jgi:hypothetical protein